MKKVFIFVFILFFCCFISLKPVNADEPLITGVRQGDVCKWEGVLMNKEAASKILANKETQEELCQLRIQKEIDILEIEHKMLMDNLSATLDSEVSERDLIIHQYENDLEDMEALLNESHNNSEWIWWGIGGTAVGMILAGTAAIVIVYAAD
jgi:hypothetical protein